MKLTLALVSCLALLFSACSPTSLPSKDVGREKTNSSNYEEDYNDQNSNSDNLNSEDYISDSDNPTQPIEDGLNDNSADDQLLAPPVDLNFLFAKCGSPFSDKIQGTFRAIGYNQLSFNITKTDKDYLVKYSFSEGEEELLIEPKSGEKIYYTNEKLDDYKFQCIEEDEVKTKNSNGDEIKTKNFKIIGLSNGYILRWSLNKENDYQVFSIELSDLAETKSIKFVKEET